MSKKDKQEIPAPPSAPQAASGKLVVAKGKSIVCGNVIGILGPGKEVKPEYLDKESLAVLVKSGTVVSE